MAVFRGAVGVTDGAVVTVPEEVVTGTETVCKGVDAGLLKVTVADDSSTPAWFSGVVRSHNSCMLLRFWFTVMVYVPKG